MNSDKLKKALPYISAILLFFMIAVAYFPKVMEGERLSQHDKKTWQGASHEVREFEKETGEKSQWTNSMFGGMPTYLITGDNPNNYGRKLYKIFDFGHKIRPISFIFLYMLGFFIALLLFGVDPWLSIVGAIAFAFSSYFFIIIQAGHITKVFAIAFMTPVIAGIYHAYKKNMLVGTLVTTFFLVMQLSVNHAQVTYYSLLIILIFMIFEIVEVIQNKTYLKFAKTSALLFAGGLLALTVNFAQIATVYDYGKDSNRGKSELSSNKEDKTSGTDKSYATAWSYGKMETFNMLIPNLYGGASSGDAFVEKADKSETYNLFKKAGYKDKDIKRGISAYWGPQPMTSGPVYIGAIVLLFFILGLFIVEGKVKWWLLSATILSILLAWGKYFGFLTDLFLDYFPLYNKFRTVSMILVIAEFTMPLLGILALKNIIEKKVETQKIIKSLIISTGILVGVILIAVIASYSVSFVGANEAKMQKELLDALSSDRASMLRADAFRSLLFVLIGAASIFLFVKEKIKTHVLYVILGLAILFDLAGVNKRYLNDSHFVDKEIAAKPFKKSAADKFILKDKNLSYRVLNLTVSTFNDASTSYYHKSIGGYHGAKMRRYQELIEHAIQPEMQALIKVLQSEADEMKIKSVLMQLTAINMLNTRYIILDPSTYPMKSQFALGNAWFVNEIKEVENADAEIKAIHTINPQITAVADKRFKEQFFKFTKDESATIKLTEYKPNALTYESNTSSDQLAVFSEIYYAKGWNAYIDGKLSPHFRVNYVLRAMKVPAGKHKIEFKFEPQLWKTANTVSLIGSILFFLFIIGLGYFIYKGKSQKEEA